MAKERPVAFITGASSGIGRATAELLASRGYECRGTYRTHAKEAKDLQLSGVASSVYELDCSDSDGVNAWATSDQGLEALADVDALILNAGEILRPGSWNEQSVEDMRATIECHLLSPVVLARQAAPGMLERKSGSIVFTGSTYGVTGAAGVLMYTAAKQAVVAVTRSLAREFGPSGVTVNCVMPGNIDTPMTQSSGQEVIDWVIQTTPLGRLGEPQEVARQTLFFLENSFVTGQVGVVDGGQLLNM